MSIYATYIQNTPPLEEAQTKTERTTSKPTVNWQANDNDDCQWDAAQYILSGPSTARERLVTVWNPFNWQLRTAVTAIVQIKLWNHKKCLKRICNLNFEFVVRVAILCQYTKI